MNINALMPPRSKKETEVSEAEITDTTRTTAKLALMVAEIRNKEEL